MQEEWKDIKGFIGIYQISNLGRVRSLDREHVSKFNIKYKYKGKILVPILNNKGYYNVSLSKNKKPKVVKIHRLVAEHFIDNPNNYPIINHIDHNRLNNKIDNLEWCSYKHNNDHSNAVKLSNISNAIQCKVLNIKTNKIDIYDSMSEAARKLNICDTTIKKYILNGNIYNNTYKFKINYA